MDLLQLRKLYRFALIFVGAQSIFIYQSWATVNISFSSSAPTALQSSFIADTTRQYLSTVTPNPFFKDTYTMVIHGKNLSYAPPAASSPILTGTAFNECIAYGFSDGMDYERDDNIRTLGALRSNVFETGTCGGLIAGTTIPAHAFLSGCVTAYNIAESTITLKTNVPPIRR